MDERRYKKANLLTSCSETLFTVSSWLVVAVVVAAGHKVKLNTHHVTPTKVINPHLKPKSTNMFC